MYKDFVKEHVRVRKWEANQRRLGDTTSLTPREGNTTGGLDGGNQTSFQFEEAEAGGGNHSTRQKSPVSATTRPERGYKLQEPMGSGALGKGLEGRQSRACDAFCQGHTLWLEVCEAHSQGSQKGNTSSIPLSLCLVRT